MFFLHPLRQCGENSRLRGGSGCSELQSEVLDLTPDPDCLPERRATAEWIVLMGGLMINSEDDVIFL